MPKIKYRALWTSKTKNTSKLKDIFIDHTLPLSISYIVKSGVIYMCLADGKYPQKLAFMFLQDVSDSFHQELQNTYGTGAVDYQSKIETIDN